MSWIHRLLTGNTGWNNTTSNNGNVRRQHKTGCQDASEFRKNTLGYHAFQTAGQWVRGELRNMQVAGQMNNDENRPKLSSQIDTEVVDQVAGLGCCAALLLWVTMTMTRSGEAIEQVQETRKRHTPDLARGLEASLLAPALPSEGAPYSGALALS